MSTLEEYIARIEEACGEEKDFIVVLKYEKKDEAISKIMKRGKVIKSFSGILLEISFKNANMRVYKTGKMILKKLRDKKEAEDILRELLL